MKHRKADEGKCPTRADRASSQPIPELPAWKAFVVQFTREVGPRSEIFAGRVEHLSSGRRARFGSAEELLAILQQQLAEIGTADLHKSGD